MKLPLFVAAVIVGCSSQACIAEGQKTASWNIEFLAEYNGAGCLDEGCGRSEEDCLSVRSPVCATLAFPVGADVRKLAIAELAVVDVDETANDLLQGISPHIVMRKIER